MDIAQIANPLIKEFCGIYNQGVMEAMQLDQDPSVLHAYSRHKAQELATLALEICRWRLRGTLKHWACLPLKACLLISPKEDT